MLVQPGLKTDDLVRDGLQKLKADGFVIFDRLLDSCFVEALYTAYKERIQAPVSYGGKFGRGFEEESVAYVDLPLTLHPNAVAFAMHEPILQMIGQYLSTDIALSYVASYRTHVIKEEETRNALMTPGVFSGWHSDANLIAPGRGYRFVVSMLYLNDVTSGDGGLQLIRGSHTYGSEKRAWLPDEIEARVEDIVEVCAPAGSVILFDMEIIHRAGIPTNHHRDIFRCCYVHDGGYAEPLVFSNDTLPAEPSPQIARLFRLGRPSSIPMPLSDGTLLDAILENAPLRRLFSPRVYLRRSKKRLRRIIFRSKTLKSLWKSIRR